MHTTESPTLDQYVELRDLYSEVKQIFPTIDSLRWFVRRHRAVLVEERALIIITGRMRFHTPTFKHAAVTIGLRAAA